MNIKPVKMWAVVAKKSGKLSSDEGGIAYISETRTTARELKGDDERIAHVPITEIPQKGAVK